MDDTDAPLRSSLALMASISMSRVVGPFFTFAACNDGFLHVDVCVCVCECARLCMHVSCMYMCVYVHEFVVCLVCLSVCLCLGCVYVCICRQKSL